MHHRFLLTLALAAAAVAPATAAMAAPGAYRAFDCDRVQGNWNLDAKFGPFTERAVKAYQQARGLKVDGVVGMETAWALKITYRQPMTCGMVGPDVLELQRALQREGFWRGHFPERAEPRAETPTAEEPPMAEAPPDLPPMDDLPPPVPPMPPIEDLPPDEVDPQPVEPPGMVVIEEMPPRLELRAGSWLVPTTGTWFVPMMGGAPNMDMSVIRQNFFAEGALFWHPAWGVGGGVQAFDLAGAVLPLGPFQTPGQLMVDGQLVYRPGGPLRLTAGYRGFTAGGPHYGAIGLGLDSRVASWLSLRGRLSGGSNFGSDYFFDGEAGFGLHAGPVGLNLAYRMIGLSNATINGPTVAATFAW